MEAADINTQDDGLSEAAPAGGLQYWLADNSNIFGPGGFTSTGAGTTPYNPSGSGGISGAADMATLAKCSPMPKTLLDGIGETSMKSEIDRLVARVERLEAHHNNLRLEALKLAITAMNGREVNAYGNAENANVFTEMAARFEDYLMHGMRPVPNKIAEAPKKVVDADIREMLERLDRMAEEPMKYDPNQHEAIKRQIDAENRSRIMAEPQWAKQELAALREMAKKADGGEGDGSIKKPGRIADQIRID